VKKIILIVLLLIVGCSKKTAVEIDIKKDFFQKHIGTWKGSHNKVLSNTQCVWGEKFIFSTDKTYRREYYLTSFFSDYKFIGYGKIKVDVVNGEPEIVLYDRFSRDDESQIGSLTLKDKEGKLLLFNSKGKLLCELKK